MTAIISAATSGTGLDNAANTGVKTGNLDKVSQALFFPLPWKEETVPHPFIGRATAFCSHRALGISWAAK